MEQKLKNAIETACVKEFEPLRGKNEFVISPRSQNEILATF